MYAVTIAEPGGPEVLRWTEVPEPEVGTGDVLIEIAAAGVNRADLLQRQGNYPPPKGAPPYPGMECSGRVLAVGDGVVGWKAGDEVCALLGGGGYAERVAVPYQHVLPVPAGVGLVDAAALPEVACTVWSNIIDLARLKPAETILIHGGGSGIGTFAVQLASAAGATVYTTARAVKHEALLALGADRCIDYTSEDFVEVVGSADVILDIMGASYLERNVRALADGGRLVVIGMQGGRKAEVDLGALLSKRGTIHATALRSRSAAQKASIIAGVRDEVWPLVAAGRVRPIVYRTIGMQEASQAHALVESNEHTGKVLLLSPSAA